MGSTYFALWRRGFWVYLMLIVINVVVGLVGGGLARLLHSAIPEPLILAFAVTLLTVGLPLSGWLFEQLASRLPRLELTSQTADPIA
jgi:hypothetical protein